MRTVSQFSEQRLVVIGYKSRLRKTISKWWVLKLEKLHDTGTRIILQL